MPDDTRSPSSAFACFSVRLLTCPLATILWFDFYCARSSTSPPILGARECRSNHRRRCEAYFASIPSPGAVPAPSERDFTFSSSLRLVACFPRARHCGDVRSRFSSVLAAVIFSTPGGGGRAPLPLMAHRSSPASPLPFCLPDVAAACPSGLRSSSPRSGPSFAAGVLTACGNLASLPVGPWVVVEPVILSSSYNLSLNAICLINTDQTV